MRIKHIAFFIFLSVYSSIFVTYPVQVFFRKIEISITLYVFLINVFLFLLIINKAHIELNEIIPFILLIFFFVISIILNSTNSRLFNFYIFRIYIVYIIWTTMVLSIKHYIYVYDYPKLLTGVLFSLGILNFIAAVAQALFWRLPPSLNIARYPWDIVGPYIRAGTFYSDSNFQAIYFTVLFYSILSLVKRRFFLKYVVLVMLAIAVLLTFSRGGLLFFVFTLFLYIVKGFKYTQHSIQYHIFLFVIVASSITLWFLFIDSSPRNIVIFQRFTSDAGQASTLSRVRQYKLLASHIAKQPGIFFRGLGPGVFVSINNEMVHNFFLSLLSEVGIGGPLVIIFLTIKYYSLNENFAMKMLFLFWILQSAVLPSIANSLFIIFILIRLVNSHKRKFRETLK